MRTILSLFLVIAACGAVVAQRPEVGFIRLVNLVAAGEGNARFGVNGQDLHAKGYSLGQKTGGMGFKAGDYTITVRKEGCTGAERKIDIEPGETQTLVAYGVPIRDKLGEVVEWQVKVARLRQKTPEKGFTVTMVSFCEEKELAVTVVAEGTPEPIKATIPRMKAHAIKAGKPQGGVRLAIDKTVIAGFYTDDPGNYVVLIYSDPEGKKKAIHYYDPKFVIAG